MLQAGAEPPCASSPRHAAVSSCLVSSGICSTFVAIAFASLAILERWHRPVSTSSGSVLSASEVRRGTALASALAPDCFLQAIAGFRVDTEGNLPKLLGSQRAASLSDG